MHEAKKASPSLPRWFDWLTKMTAEFDQYILELAKNVPNLVRTGHSDVVVNMIKIVEIEGKEDEKVNNSSAH